MVLNKKVCYSADFFVVFFGLASAFGFSSASSFLSVLALVFLAGFSSASSFFSAFGSAFALVAFFSGFASFVSSVAFSVSGAAESKFRNFLTMLYQFAIFLISDM